MSAMEAATVLKHDRTTHLSTYLFALPATVLSFAVTGLADTFNNNVYHIPILLKLYDLPQFAGDDFVQSLRHFSSGFWLVFAGIGNAVDVRLFLFGWVVLTHYAFLASAIHFARSLGQRDTGVLNAFVVLLSVSSLACNVAVGGGGVMIQYFSHSELANASLILGFSSCLRKQYGLTVIWTAVTFFLNAFMAVWMVLPLLCALIPQMRNEDFSLRKLTTRFAAGLLVGVPIAAIPLLNLIGTATSAAPAFSYRTFIWEMYPFHFYILSLDGAARLALAGVAIAAVLVALRLQRKPHALIGLIAGAIGVVVVGGIATLFSDNRLLIGLHLIRSAVMVTMLAAIGLALYAAVRLVRPSGPSDRPFGAIVAGALILPGTGFLLAIPLIALELLPSASSYLSRLCRSRVTSAVGIGFLALSVLVLLTVAANRIREADDYYRQAPKWRAIGLWAKANTPANATLIALPGRDEFVATPMLEYVSGRSVWYDKKFSAAVLWSPAYHAIYAARSRVLEALRTSPGERLDIARQNGIDYVITLCRDEAGVTPVHAEGDVCVFGGKLR